MSTKPSTPKEAVATWLMCITPPAREALSTYDRRALESTAAALVLNHQHTIEENDAAALETEDALAFALAGWRRAHDPAGASGCPAPNCFGKDGTHVHGCVFEMCEQELNAARKRRGEDTADA